MIKGSGVVNEWNAVGGYYDLLIGLIKMYYEASITSGGTDDIESFKRLVDHVQCKFTNNEAILGRYCKNYMIARKLGKIKEDSTFLDWIDLSINKVESNYARVMKLQKNSGNKQPIQEAIEQLSENKKLLRLLFRDVMGMLEGTRVFNMDRHFNKKEDLTADLG